MLWGCQNILVANSHYHHAVTKVGKNELTPLALATWSFNFVLHAGGLLFGSQFRLRRVELELEVFQSSWISTRRNRNCAKSGRAGWVGPS